MTTATSARPERESLSVDGERLPVETNRSHGLPYFSWTGSVSEAPSVIRGLIGTRLYQSLKTGYGWLKHEKNDHSHLALSQKLSAWRRGFFAESAILYDLSANDPRDYLSDYARAARCREINPHNDFFSHKLVLRSFLLAMGFRQAETVALLYEGKILSNPFNGDARQIEPGELEEQLASSGRNYIVKPEDGACGKGLFLLETDRGELVRRHGRQTAPFDLPPLLRETGSDQPRPRMTFIEEQLDQAAFWDRLFPESANTIRVLTLWMPGEPAPFIARAVQRIGTPETVPTDNWSGGGISAPIDLESGTLREGRANPFKSGQATADRLFQHPATGAQIAGAVLPYWGEVRDTVLRAAASLPFNRVAGWDVLVASDGVPVIIEANGDSDINLLQVHGGLLADSRIRRFYEVTAGVARK
jgi:hypothetical protein